MNRNRLLYNASIALVECAKFVKHIDSDFAKLLLDKAQEYKNQIIAIDKKVEDEINRFEKRIEKRL